MLDMIHGSSTDPVLIKKIGLKVWLLRDEIEAVIKHRMKNLQEGEKAPTTADLMQEYREVGHLNGPDEEEGGVKDAADLDDSGEAEMLAAMGGGEDEAEETEEASEESSEETEQASNEAPKLEIAPVQKDDGKMVIRQRSPLLESEKLYECRSILSEIAMTEMFFFSGKQFLEGQSIVIEFMIPKRFLVNARVIFCREYNMKSRIISKNRLPYRVGVVFTFLKEGERTLLRQFCESIEPDIPEAPVQDASSGGGGDDDDDLFDDLDDL